MLEFSNIIGQPQKSSEIQSNGFNFPINTALKIMVVAASVFLLFYALNLPFALVGATITGIVALPVALFMAAFASDSPNTSKEETAGFFGSIVKVAIFAGFAIGHVIDLCFNRYTDYTFGQAVNILFLK
ncbi:MAG: hypothetical protein WC688_03250 [Parachlamydiales bacterium]|jgi:hypothetical protein